MTDQVDEAAGVRVPPIIALMWGREQPQRRGPKPALTLEMIATAAVEIADDEGFPAVSMSRVAARLGFSTMALYRYVNSKDDLVALMFDLGGGTPDPRIGQADDWRSGLERWILAYRDVLRAHRWMAAVPVSGPPLAPNQLAWMDAALATMSSTPLTPEEKMSVLLLATNYTRIAVQLESQLAEAARQAGPERAPVMREYGHMVLDLIDPADLPALYETFAGEAFAAEDNIDDEFEFGLTTLLDGVAARIAERSASRRGS